jgi:hypothetical protein
MKALALIVLLASTLGAAVDEAMTKRVLTGIATSQSNAKVIARMRLTASATFSPTPSVRRSPTLTPTPVI